MPIRKILKTVGLSFAWTLLVFAGLFIVRLRTLHSLSSGNLSAIESHIRNKVSESVAGHKVGCAAFVLIEQGEIVAEHGFGIANADSDEVITDKTLYLVASVSKAVTAWGIMNLAEEGKISLDTPVVAYLKRWRFQGSEKFGHIVTARHLLTHTAGLDDGFGYKGFSRDEQIQTLEESLAITRDVSFSIPRGVKVTRQPGVSMAYSGAGYAILQLLIEDVTNKSFNEYMKEEVLRPLGMDKATFDLDEIFGEGRASDVSISYDRDLAPQPLRGHTAKAAVSLYATPRDLARFVIGYTTENAVLNRATIEEMIQPQPGTSGSWGLGNTIFARNDDGRFVVGHDGGTFPAWGAWIRVNTSTGNGMVMMVSGGHGSLNQIANDWLFWETGVINSDSWKQLLFDNIIPTSLFIIFGCLATGVVIYRKH